MSGEWHARFEFVSGPYDGLTFTIAHDGVSLGSEIADLPPVQKPDLGDFDDVEFEVGGEGVKLTCDGTFTLNGEQVSGTREMSQGNIVKIGASEVLLVEYSTGAAQEDEGGGRRRGRRPRLPRLSQPQLRGDQQARRQVVREVRLGPGGPGLSAHRDRLVPRGRMAPPRGSTRLEGRRP